MGAFLRQCQFVVTVFKMCVWASRGVPGKNGFHGREWVLVHGITLEHETRWFVVVDCGRGAFKESYAPTKYRGSVRSR
jgi:hypothetical protein